jgi:prepilin-type N-terminal cleavage/methylation domain-containing protein
MDRHHLDAELAMRTHKNAQGGFSLLETIVSMGVLSVGALGLAGVFAAGMQKTVSSPGELLATQKAAEAIESVFSARDSHTVPWAQLRNVPVGGIFLTGPQPLKLAGADGVVNTADDAAVESVVLPGRDQLLGTGDDVTQTLGEYTREIQIVDLSADLRAVTVTVTYRAGTTMRPYSLTAYISTFA